MTQSPLPKSVEAVLKEIESREKEVKSIGRRAFQEGEYARTQVLIRSATRLEILKSTIYDFGIELADIFSEIEYQTKEMPAGRIRQRAKRIPRGKKTPESAYHEPILKALVDLGGNGTTSEVLDHVYDQMKNDLNEYDKQPVPSVPSQQRWRHTAQLVRTKLIKEGLIKGNSSRGIWELTASGKKSVSKKTSTSQDNE